MSVPNWPHRNVPSPECLSAEVSRHRITSQCQIGRTKMSLHRNVSVPKCPGAELHLSAKLTALKCPFIEMSPCRSVPAPNYITAPKRPLTEQSLHRNVSVPKCPGAELHLSAELAAIIFRSIEQFMIPIDLIRLIFRSIEMDKFYNSGDN